MGAADADYTSGVRLAEPCSAWQCVSFTSAVYGHREKSPILGRLGLEALEGINLHSQLKPVLQREHDRPIHNKLCSGPGIVPMVRSLFETDVANKQHGKKQR